MRVSTRNTARSDARTQNLALKGTGERARTPSTTAASPCRITRPQQRKPRLQTLFDLRRVRRVRTTGLHEDRSPSMHLYDEPEQERRRFARRVRRNYSRDDEPSRTFWSPRAAPDHWSNTRPRGMRKLSLHQRRNGLH